MERPVRPEWKIVVDLLREVDPHFFRRIVRKMMNFLFKQNVARAEELIRQLDEVNGELAHHMIGSGENQAMPRVKSGLLEMLMDETFVVASQEMTDDEIISLVRLWLKQDRLLFLTRITERRDSTLNDIRIALQRFDKMFERQQVLPAEEAMGIRVGLIRRFFSEDLDYINTTKDLVRIGDFSSILSRTIGPTKGSGKLGGKAGGLFRAEKILDAAKEEHRVLSHIMSPKTWYLTSDVLFEFMHFNALEEISTMKYREVSGIKREYGYLNQIFKNSFLPPEIVDGLKLALDDFGDTPLIVRSSSLLEDSKQSSFAGKYKSLFVANRGSREKRLEDLEDAVLEVFASTFGPDPIEYRRERGLLDFNEEMGIMIQQVVGKKVGRYFFPAFSGVAFSLNEFRWSPRIRRTDGVVRLVAGLGTRAVDRMGDDYPTLVSPGMPGLRANVTPEDIVRYSQRNIDVLDLKAGTFETVEIEKLIDEVTYDFPQLSNVVSLLADDNIRSPRGMALDLSEGKPIVTFSNLLQHSRFIKQINLLLQVFQESLGFPVDLEFAAGEDPDSLYLLQCRTQCYSGGRDAISIPKNIADSDKLFSARRFVTSGQVHQIEFLVYVDPEEYGSLSTVDQMTAVGHAIGELNSRLPPRRFILMGPGRWGSRGDIKLGVRVNYSDINNTAMLIEIARRKLGQTPDLSFGTHFFQDLVESRISYLPLYPDEDGVLFNEAFFRDSPNQIGSIISAEKLLEKVIKVIHLPRIRENTTASVVMDGENDQALAFLSTPQPQS